jgi:hypothetical protein
MAAQHVLAQNSMSQHSKLHDVGREYLTRGRFQNPRHTAHGRLTSNSQTGMHILDDSTGLLTGLL